MDFPAAAALLEQSEDYRVLRRFAPRVRYHEEPWNLGDRSQVKLGVFVDVETTGLDTKRDEIIEFAAVPFSYEPTTGVIYEIFPSVSGFEEPTIPVHPDARAKHGITDDMLRGQVLHDTAICELVGRASIVIAHNAEFDRQMLERRLPVFREIAWGCSFVEVPWELFGCDGKKLVHVLLGARREFYAAHRALDDCHVGVHCLAAENDEGRTALSYLLESARAPTTRVWARRAAFSLKDDLKERGYRWHNDSRTWVRDVRGERFDAAVVEEATWLNDRGVIADYTTLTARDRYSVRGDR